MAVRPVCWNIRFNIVRAKREAQEQYESLRSPLDKTKQRQGLEYFKVPSVTLESIRSKLSMQIFDEYPNTLKGMYSIQFNGRSDQWSDCSRPREQSNPTSHGLGITPSLINSLTP